LKFEIIGRSGCGDFLYMLVLEEEVIFTVESDDFKELENKLGGVVLKIEGEKCVLFTRKSLSKIKKLLKGNKDALEQFRNGGKLASGLR